MPDEALRLVVGERDTVRTEGIGQRLGVEVAVLIGRQGIDHVGLGVIEEIVGQLIQFRLFCIVLGHLSQDVFHGRLPDIEGVDIGIRPIVREDGIDVGLCVLHVADPGGSLEFHGIVARKVGGVVAFLGSREGMQVEAEVGDVAPLGEIVVAPGLEVVDGSQIGGIDHSGEDAEHEQRLIILIIDTWHLVVEEVVDGPVAVGFQGGHQQGVVGTLGAQMGHGIESALPAVEGHDLLEHAVVGVLVDLAAFQLCLQGGHVIGQGIHLGRRESHHLRGASGVGRAHAQGSCAEGGEILARSGLCQTIVGIQTVGIALLLGRGGEAEGREQQAAHKSKNLVHRVWF